MKTLAPALLLALPVPGALAQTTHVVDDDCVVPGVFCTIQEALVAASPGDTILVRPGTYGAIDFLGKDVRVVSEQGPAVTTIESGPGPHLVRFVSGETRAAELAGFTVRQALDHAILVQGSAPTIRGNVLRDNDTNEEGPALRIEAGSDPLVVDNRILDNLSLPSTNGDGGAVHVSASSARFEGNEIRGNAVFADCFHGFGGGIYVAFSDVELLGNLIVGNFAQDEALNRGGGLYATGSTLLLVGNTFADNVAADSLPFFCGFPSAVPGEGGALYLQNTQATIVDCIFWNDVAGSGPEIAGGDLLIAHTDLEGGLAAIHAASSVAVGEGLLDVDPSWTGYRLDPSSPLVDVGSGALGMLALDGDAEPRRLDGDLDGASRVDLGWDEYDPTGLVQVGTATPGATITFETTGPAGWIYFLAWSPEAAVVPLEPYGSILLAGPGLTPHAFGSVPGSDAVQVPNDPGLVGLGVFSQALAKAPGVKLGSFSRRVETRVQ